METYTEEDIGEKIRLHGLWIKGVDGGAKADLSHAYLNWRDLHGRDLSGSSLCYSNLRCSNFSGCDFSGCDFSNSSLGHSNFGLSNLTGATLFGTIGNGREIKSMQLEGEPIAYTAEIIQIGCENHKIEEWWAFTDIEISSMWIGALEWWRKHKRVLQLAIEISPATPTGHEGK